MSFSSQIISRVADEIAKQLSKSAIEWLRKRHRDSNMMASPEDSGLMNLWEEFCVQLQGEKRESFGTLEETVRDFLVLKLESYAKETVCAVWLQTDEGKKWQDGLENPDELSLSDVPFKADAVALYVYENAVCPAAKRCGDYRVKRFLAYNE